MENMTILHRLLYLFKQFELKIGLTNERLPVQTVKYSPQLLTREKTWTVVLSLAFILHNTEEAFTEGSLHGTLVQMYSSYSLSAREQVMASSLMSCFSLVWLVLAFRSRQLTHISGINTALAAILLFNAFVPHLYLFVLEQRYTPGLITVFALSLPAGIAQMVRQRRQRTLALPQLVKCLWAGLIIGLFCMTLALSISKILV